MVDAGGKGFVRMLEGVVRYIEGDPDPRRSTDADAGRRPRCRPRWSRSPPSGTSSSAPRCWSAGEQLPPANEVRAAMHTFGGSVVVAAAGDILKIHVHTDSPGGRL